MFGDMTLIDYMSDEELKKTSAAIRQLAANRRKEHVETVEKRYVAVVITYKHITLGSCVEGVVLLRNDHKLRDRIKLVHEIVKEAPSTNEGALRLRALGIPVLMFARVTRNDVLSPQMLEIDYGFGARTFSTAGAETGRRSAKKATRRSMSHKDAEEGFDTETYLCQQCQKRYSFGASTSTHPGCFCSGLCQVAYKQLNGIEHPKICNLTNAISDALLAADKAVRAQTETVELLTAVAEAKNEIMSLGEAKCRGKTIKAYIRFGGDGAPIESFTVREVGAFDDDNTLSIKLRDFKFLQSAVAFCIRSEQESRRAQTETVEVSSTVVEVEKALKALGEALCRGKLIRRALLFDGDAAVDGFEVDGVAYGFMDLIAAVTYCIKDEQESQRAQRETVEIASAVVEVEKALKKFGEALCRGKIIRCALLLDCNPAITVFTIDGVVDRFRDLTSAVTFCIKDNQEFQRAQSLSPYVVEEKRAP
jgi:hypothetical protein